MSSQPRTVSPLWWLRCDYPALYNLNSSQELSTDLNLTQQTRLTGGKRAHPSSPVQLAVVLSPPEARVLPSGLKARETAKGGFGCRCGAGRTSSSSRTT